MPAEKKQTMDNIHENMWIYGQVQDTPKDAQKEIGAGRLKGYTDINPMWRIKKLTEVFGPAGVGWWTQNEKYTLQTCEKTGEIACFCQLELVYVDPKSGVASHPVTGVGGNKFVAMERNGPYCNDEAYKMAYTDALSIACKALGFSHDIYFAKDRTKYCLPEDAEKVSGEAPAKPKHEEHSEESVKVIQMIDNKLAEIGKNMKKDEKISYAKSTIVPVIGSMNYKSCTDVAKLTALLDKLNAA